MLDRTEDQKNWPLAAAEDYLTRTYVLPLLANQELREKLIEEHRKNPIGIAGRQGKPGVGHSPVTWMDGWTSAEQDKAAGVPNPLGGE